MWKYLSLKNLYVRRAGAVVLGMMVLAFVLMVKDLSSTTFFSANTLLNLDHDPFNGTVYPYKYSADWVNLNGHDRDLSFNEIPDSKLLDPVKYVPGELAVPLDDLGFSASEKVLRNAKITYSVPYKGNYKLDGKEGAGSHPAVDIKLPMFTPVLAMGNGVVTKVENLEGGFGKHIVIRHNNFPDFDNPGSTTTYFSSYSHMGRIDVEVGMKVRKGQLIGASGDSGSATTPHLHFQIDKVSSPWQPYWPFSVDDMNKAGVNSFEAINEGLGMENIINYTINPLMYVQAYFDATSNIASNKGTNSDGRTYVIESNPRLLASAESDVEKDSGLRLLTPDSMLLGREYEVELQFSNGMRLDVDKVRVKPTLEADFEKPNKVNMHEGYAKIAFIPRELGNMNIEIEYYNDKIYSKNIAVKLFEDIMPGDLDFNYLKYLKNKEILNGYEDGTFQPENLINKAEVSKILVDLIKKNTEFDEDELGEVALEFDDVEREDWFYDSVELLARRGAVNLSQTNFMPGKAINLPELLKLMFEAVMIDVDPVVSSRYEEMFDITAWYAEYLQLALKMDLIEEEDLENPLDTSLTRREVARIMAKFLQEMND